MSFIYEKQFRSNDHHGWLKIEEEAIETVKGERHRAMLSDRGNWSGRLWMIFGFNKTEIRTTWHTPQSIALSSKIHNLQIWSCELAEKKLWSDTVRLLSLRSGQGQILCKQSLSNWWVEERDSSCYCWHTCRNNWKCSQ